MRFSLTILTLIFFTSLYGQCDEDDDLGILMALKYSDSINIGEFDYPVYSYVDSAVLNSYLDTLESIECSYPYDKLQAFEYRLKNDYAYCPSGLIILWKDKQQWKQYILPTFGFLNGAEIIPFSAKDSNIVGISYGFQAHWKGGYETEFFEVWDLNKGKRFAHITSFEWHNRYHHLGDSTSFYEYEFRREVAVKNEVLMISRSKFKSKSWLESMDAEYIEEMINFKQDSSYCPEVWYQIMDGQFRTIDENPK